MANKDLPNRSENASNDEAFERELSRALNSLPVPPGLRANLMEGIRQVANRESERSPAGQELLQSQPSRLSERPAGVEMGGPESVHQLESRTQPQVETWRAAKAPSEPKRFHSRRFHSRRLLAFLSVGTAAAVLMAFFLFNQPLSKEQLAAHCRAVLREVEVGQAAWTAGEPSPEFWNPLTSLALARSAQVVGSQELAASRFGQGVLWNLKSGRQSFYIFEFQSSRSISDIEQQLRVIDHRSGGWSLAACEDKGRIVVVAVKGEIILDVPSYAFLVFGRRSIFGA